MKTTKKVVDSTTVKLDVEIALSEVADTVQKAYDEIGKQIKADGFRKGKVPRSLINAKVGEAYVLNEIVNEVINSSYQEAAKKEDLKVMSAPTVDVEEIFKLNDEKSVLKYSAEVSVRPEISIPDFSKEEVKVEIKKPDDRLIEMRLDMMRQSIATKSGTSDQGDQKVELPELNDEFAKNFQADTLKELKERIKSDLEIEAVAMTISVAGDSLLETILKKAKFDLPKKVVEAQTEQLLSQNNQQGNDSAKKEPTEEEKKAAAKRAESDIRSQILLDSYADANNIKVSSDEVVNYASNMAAQYGIEPNQFLQMLIQQGSFPMVAAEVSRSKTLSHMLKQVKVKDQNGKVVDYSPWIGSDDDAKTAKTATASKPKRDPQTKGSAKTTTKTSTKSTAKSTK